MDKLEKLGNAALDAQLVAQEAKEIAEDAKAAFLAELEKKHLLSPDFKATGHVRVKVVANRYFDVEEAFAELPKRIQKEVMVAKPDPKLVKANLTPIQLEAHMKDYSNPWKVGLSVLGDD